MNVDLADVPAWRMTPKEALLHLTCTFDQAARLWRDLMEPYLPMLTDADTDATRMAVMRQGLRETFSKRWPA